MLGVSPTTAGNRIADARALAENPELVNLVRAGALRMYPARRISADLATLDAEQRSQVCATLIAGISDRARRGLRAWTGTEVRSAARRARVKLGAPVERKAREAARAARRVCLTPDVDGMSWLSAYLPEAEAARVYRRLSAEAQALATDHNNQDLDGEPRTADQIRADLLVDQLLAHPGTQTCSGPSVTSPTGGPGAHRESVAEPYADISVVIDLATLCGLAQNPGEIRGMGPIPADVARELAADGRWRAWITATRSNATVVATSPGTYTPGAALARLIRAREPVCRMPGCRASAERCDLDHTIAFPQPPGTTEQNLVPE